MTKENILEKLTCLRSKAFEMANSGKHGRYPLDETFNDAVEEGFSHDGTSWTAKDGTVIGLTKFSVGEHVRFINDNSLRNHYVISEILFPGEKLSEDDGWSYPGWSIKGYVNDTAETVYILPDALSGITFAALESEIESIPQ